jgi:7-cyano-7-deazaguanine synthase
MIRKRKKRVKETVCALASGGVDSSVMIAELARRFRVQPLYIRCGFKWEAAEIFWLKKYLSALPRTLKKNLSSPAILSLPADDLFRNGHNHWTVSKKRPPGYHSADEAVYLPGRNLLLLSKAATFCAVRKISRLVLGSLSGNPFSDASPRFLRAMQRAARLALDYPIRISAPFRKLTKDQVVKKGLRLPLQLSFSCLSPRGYRPCGECNKCAERAKVLAFK